MERVWFPGVPVIQTTKGVKLNLDALNELLNGFEKNDPTKKKYFAEGLIDQFMGRIVENLHNMKMGTKRMLGFPAFELTEVPGDPNSFLIAQFDKSAIKVSLTVLNPEEVKVLANTEETVK